MAFPSEPAEDAFELFAATHGIEWHRFGLQHPNFEYLRQMSPFLLATPDYLIETQQFRYDHLLDFRGWRARHILVECKGVGKDQTIKIKEANVEELERWQEVSGRPVALFIFDSHKNRCTTLLSLDDLEELTAMAPTDRYPDNDKVYWKIPTKWIREWISVSAMEDEAA